MLAPEDGTVREERIILDNPASQEDWSRLRAVSTTAFAAPTPHHGDPRLHQGSDLSPDEALATASRARMLAQLDILTSDVSYHDGIVHRSSARNSSTSTPTRCGRWSRRWKEPVDAALAPQATQADGVNIIIGGENEADALEDMSVVVARYGERAQGGLLGIVGPTRMQYGGRSRWRAI